MLIYAVADLHGSQYRLNLVINNVEKYSPNLVVVCGDITQFGPGAVAKSFLNQIPIETYAVPGNIDTDDVEEAINCSKAKNLNKNKIIKDGLSFVGISAVNENITDFFLSRNEVVVDKKTVLATHVPPFGIQDKTFVGMHLGSKVIRRIVEVKKPILVLSGHIHEDPGYSKFDETYVVNCSLGKHGEGAIIKLDKNISVEMLE